MKKTAPRSTASKRSSSKTSSGRKGPGSRSSSSIAEAGIGRTDLARLAAKRARDSLIFFTQFHDPHYEPSEFHYALAEVLEKVAAGEIKRLILNVPPRHGKSRLTAIEFAAWMLGHNPRAEIVNAGYAKDLALDASKATRDIMRSDAYHAAFRTKLNPMDQKAEHWRTMAGGSYLAVGRQGALTGRGADLLIVDDPIRDVASAESPAIRDDVWSWFQGVALTRLSPTGAVVIIQTRWHTDDLTGRLLDPDRLADLESRAAEETDIEIHPWTVINLPALAEDDDPLGRKPGEALWPERWPASHLRGLRAEMMPFLWSALYCGDPEVDGGNYVDVRNFSIISKADLPANLRWCRFWDLATKEKQKADYTAGAKVAILPDGRAAIADVQNEKLNWPDARNLIGTIGTAESIPVGIEAVAGFETSVQNVREVYPELFVRGINVVTDKLARALPWFAKLAAREVVLVAGDWVAPFIRQVREFPSGKHDDMVDAVSGAYQMAKAIHNAGRTTIDRRSRSDRESLRVGTRAGQFAKRGRLLV